MPNILAKVEGYVVTITITEKLDGKFKAIVSCPVCHKQRKSDNAKNEKDCKRSVANNLRAHIKSSHK